MNGTFRWDYPKGHTMVHFSNPQQTAYTVCFLDDLGGDIFTIIDKTGGRNGKTLSGFENGNIVKKAYSQTPLFRING